jgi:hypothetical protein
MLRVLLQSIVELLEKHSHKNRPDYEIKMGENSFERKRVGAT